jgi:hypothetical protein
LVGHHPQVQPPTSGGGRSIFGAVEPRSTAWQPVSQEDDDSVSSTSSGGALDLSLSSHWSASLSTTRDNNPTSSNQAAAGSLWAQSAQSRMMAGAMVTPPNLNYHVGDNHQSVSTRRASHGGGVGSSVGNSSGSHALGIVRRDYSGSVYPGSVYPGLPDPNRTKGVLGSATLRGFLVKMAVRGSCCLRHDFLDHFLAFLQSLLHLQSRRAGPWNYWWQLLRHY